MTTQPTTTDRQTLSAHRPAAPCPTQSGLPYCSKVVPPGKRQRLRLLSTLVLMLLVSSGRPAMAAAPSSGAPVLIGPMHLLLHNKETDLTAPTINNLPSWGTGVASGSTTANTVNMTDESAWGASSNISITADNGGTISGLDTTSYGDKTFNFIAPANPGPNSLDVTITYSITDAGGNVTTETQVVPVAAEVAPDVIAPSKTGESFPNLDTMNTPFSGTMTFDENVASVTSISMDLSGCSASVTGGLGTSTLSISGNTGNVAGYTQITITVEDASGNSRTITSNTYSVM